MDVGCKHSYDADGTGRKVTFPITHTDMWLPMNASLYVHNLGYHLKQPEWYQQFEQIVQDRGLTIQHIPNGGWCNACAAEGRIKRFDDDYWDDY